MLITRMLITCTPFLLAITVFSSYIQHLFIYLANNESLYGVENFTSLSSLYFLNLLSYQRVEHS